MGGAIPGAGKCKTKRRIVNRAIMAYPDISPGAVPGLEFDSGFGFAQQFKRVATGIQRQSPEHRGCTLLPR